ncbi:MAG: chaperone, ATP12 [Acetobacteraceae bacterium]|nr:chaperone, ATP12 [Acetobacteraceae bacterium]MDW8399557.1 ATP12 family protein [Acetobacteraceae bacterium]
MKRFWDRAEPCAAGDGFAVLLDGRPVRLPGGTALAVGSRPLAEALAEEWDRAGGGKGAEVRWEELGLTRLVGTAIERIAPDPSPTVAALAAYAETDLLCYRAEDARLAERQAREWQPLLDWAALALDAPLRVTVGLMPVPQPAGSVGAIRAVLAARPPLMLAALGAAVPALGSVVLGLALAEGRLDAAEAARLAMLDETFQAELWGEDAEAAARRAAIRADLALAARLMALAA